MPFPYLRRNADISGPSLDVKQIPDREPSITIGIEDCNDSDTSVIISPGKMNFTRKKVSGKIHFFSSGKSGIRVGGL